MNPLRTYLNSLSVVEQERFAARCGTTLGYLRKTLSTGASLREKLCASLERESAKLVRRQDLREDWREVWPELAELVDESVTAKDAA